MAWVSVRGFKCLFWILLIVVIGKSHVSQIESGRKTGTVETLGRLARALGVDLDDLAPPGSEEG